MSDKNCPYCGTPYGGDTDAEGNLICGCDDETMARQSKRIAALEHALARLVRLLWAIDDDAKDGCDCEQCVAYREAEALVDWRAILGSEE